MIEMGSAAESVKCVLEDVEGIEEAGTLAGGGRGDIANDGLVDETVVRK